MGYFLNLISYAYWFLGVLAIITAIVLFAPNFWAKSVTDPINFLSMRGLKVEANEINKFALLRIVFGLILVIRAWNLYYLLPPSDFENTFVYFFAVTNIVAGLLLMLGLLTQYTLVWLVLIQWHLGDSYLGTSTLGNDIAAIVAVFFLIVNAGRQISLDYILLKHSNKLRGLLLYYKNLPTVETVRAGKVVALFSYWLICIYSLCMHLNESAWMTGAAGPLLLSNNFMATYHHAFAAIFTESSFSVMLAKVGLWGMLPWYAFIFPFVLLGGWWRKYIIIWGVLFFSLSLFVLQLGSLAEIEFILWAALFWTAKGIKHPQSYLVAYDDKCNLCDKTVKLIRFTDVFDRVKLMPVSQRIDWLSANNITVDAALADLHGLDKSTGKLYRGYGFYTQLCKVVVLLWPAYPFFLLGNLFGIGPKIYAWIARRRVELFGVCMIPSVKKAYTDFSPQINTIAQKKTVSILLLNALFCGVGYIISIPMPYLGWLGYSNSLAEAAHVGFGITPIDVFNKTDLRMTENWFTLSAVNGASRYMVPVFDKDGSRLKYHRSDRVYFGNTVGFRRVHIGQEGCYWDGEKARMLYLAEIFLHQNSFDKNKTEFTYTQYYQPAPNDVLLAKNIYRKNPVIVRCQIEFSFAR